MKKHSITFLIVLLAAVLFKEAHAEERIGDLVFETMRKIETRQAAFLSDARQIREDRKKTITDKEGVKKKYLRAREGTLEQKEAHAELTYSVAKIFKQTFDEMNLVRSASEDHLTTLTTLRESLQNGSIGVNEKAAKKIVKDTGSFLESSDKLLVSIGKYADLISDPAINRKLASARATALLLSDYLANSQKTNSTAKNTQQLLATKVGELINNLEEIYNQSDILLDMMRDRSNVLKLTNEIAAAELAIMKLANGNTVVTSLSKEVMGPLKQVMKDTDSDIELLTNGMLNNSMSGGQEARDASWSKGLKNRE